MDDDLRILVLGDEESPEDLIEYELSKSNLRFMALRVTSREAFLRALQEFSPNLILVPTGCTGIGGLTALALAQEICPGTPCFLINLSPRRERVPGSWADQICGASPGDHGINLKSAISTFVGATGITTLTWAEPEAPREPSEALQPILQLAGVIIAVLSPEGLILEFNRGAERLTGWRRHEILGQDGIDLFFPEAYRMLAMVHLNLALSGISVESLDLPLKVRNGSTTAYRWYCNLVSDRFGQPTGIMLVGQRLSESKPWENLRARLVRSCSYPTASRGRRAFTRRTGTC